MCTDEQTKNRKENEEEEGKRQRMKKTEEGRKKGARVPGMSLERWHQNSQASPQAAHIGRSTHTRSSAVRTDLGSYLTRISRLMSNSLH